MYNLEFGQRLKHYRIQSGLSQCKVGQKLGFKFGESVCRYEQGHIPKVSRIEELAQILNVSFEDLTNGIKITKGSDFVCDFGDRLKHYREKKQLNQVELADVMGISPSLICRYENNVRKPTKKQVHQLADVLNFNVGELYIN